MLSHQESSFNLRKYLDFGRCRDVNRNNKYNERIRIHDPSHLHGINSTSIQFYIGLNRR